ncbi:alkyldihydroxyacetonephosphate synthase [Spinactinospora alkalitolerans]|uniref:Alkyldihydroxyacetonephosphate synthase n=1 Tax=Spinactinospora alkalitolerans TaxID=687207 RepID=A0A852U0D0_9ACTN|nr:FAD-binding oxidoreductase [Spinactinospora alkalitolerans]NYE48463.1 alkyldihydroxyacetonephosphate synthase [Spinactinospora alkalitolerans]
MTEYDLPVVERHPYLWGNVDTPGHLPDAAGDAMSALGAVPPGPAVDPANARLPQTSLPAEVTAALTAALGAEHVDSGRSARVRRTRGFSTPDLLKLRSGDATDAPDAVLFPGSHDDVVRVLEICTEHRVAVVPFSGGTSVVGGLAPVRAGFAGVVALDLRRLDRLVGVDEISRTAVLETGLRGVAAERLLAERGYTLGHFPQSYEMATVGGYAAARSAGQSSAGYGRFDEMVVGLTVATPRGTLTLGTAPKSAAGPDLRQLVLGSEGAFGVITSVTVRVRPRPAARVFEGWKFGSFAEGAAALRALVQDGVRPTVLRLSDEAETAVNLADPDAAAGGSGSGGCLVIAGYEGDAEEVEATRAAAAERLLAHGGQNQGAEPGEKWREGRFRGPYLRDPLFDAGALVETLETATFWSNIESLKTAVSEAVQGALNAQDCANLVMCHISHVYETGASLYFTVVTRQLDDPVAQWAKAKEAANAAIRAHGATISHHHGVGTDHRETLALELGPIGIDMIKAVKSSVDPAGVLNPGILIG